MRPRRQAGTETRALLLACMTLAALTGCGRLVHRSPAADVTAAAPAKQHGRGRHAKANATPAAETAPAPPRDPLAQARAEATASPAEPYWPFHVAQLELARDSSAAAERALTDALARDRDYAPALALLTRLEFQSGRNLDAIDRLEAARRRAAEAGRPFAPELLAGLALHYDAIDRLDRAAPLTAQLPDDGSPDERTAQVFLRLRGSAPDSATGLAERAAHERPNRAADQNNLGITRLRAADPDGAQAAFERAIRLDPALPGPYYNLAILEKFYRFDDDAAARWYAAYRARSSDDPDGLARVFTAPAASSAHPAPEDEEAKP